MLVKNRRPAPDELDLYGTGLDLVDVQYYLQNPHALGILVGRDKLTPIHSEWILDTWYRPKHIHTSLQAHRGAYKTTAVTDIGCPHFLLTNWNSRIALVRENSLVASQSLGAISQIMQHELYRLLFKAINGFFPDLTVNRSDALDLACRNVITKELTLMAFGIETIKTGNHFDIIHCDDVITINDRLSKAKRERTIQGIIEIRTNIIDPGCSVHFVGTPWHEQDGWAHCPTPLKYPVGVTGVMTPEQIEEKKALTTPSLWAANMLLEHMPDESNLFKELAARGNWSMEHPYRAVAHLDAKYSGKDTNALTLMSKLADGRIQVLGKVFHENVKTLFPEIKKICAKYKVQKLYNETNKDEGFVADELEKRDAANGVRGVVVGTTGRYRETMNKHVKISTFGLKWWPKLVWAEETDEEYILQVLDYMEGQGPDDAPDSMASLLRMHFDEGKKHGISLSN